MDHGPPDLAWPGSTSAETARWHLTQALVALGSKDPPCSWSTEVFDLLHLELLIRSKKRLYRRGGIIIKEADMREPTTCTAQSAGTFDEKMLQIILNYVYSSYIIAIITIFVTVVVIIDIIIVLQQQALQKECPWLLRL